MTDAVAALTPVFLMIIAGATLGYVKFPGADFWNRAATLTYWVLLPALLLRATANSDLASADVAGIATVVIVPILAIFGLMALVRRATALEFALDPAFIQSCVRQNSYVALAASFALWGDRGLAVLALVLAIYVPFVNVASTWLLARGQTQRNHRRGGRLRQFLVIATNPLVLACVAGIALAQIGLSLPPVIDASLELIGRAALPLALMAIGASLRLDFIRGRVGWLAAAMSIKLLVFPLVTWMLAKTLGLGPIELAVTVLVAAMPTAASAYPLTREMGGDAGFVASAITLQTLAAVLTVPLLVLLINQTIR